MKPLKTMTLSLTVAGMLSAFAVPALADGRGHDSRGYASQNHNGYANSRHSGHNNNQYNGYRGKNQNYRGHDNNNRRHDNNYRGHDNRNYNNNRYYRPAPQVNYNYYTPRYSYNPHQRIVYAPNFRNHGYHQRYQLGARFYNYDRYLISDYQRFGLYNPPRGHYWVRNDNDAYLAAAGTGLIAGVIIGALASGY